MKSLYLLFLLPAILFSSEDLHTKVQNLENELAKLKEDIRMQQEDLDERLPIIEANEKKSILDKINLSPELLLRVDKLTYATGKIGDGDQTLVDPNDPLNSPFRRDRYTKNFEPAGYVRMRLNMSAQIEDMKFYGRLLYANSTQSHQRLCILSRDIKTAPAGSAFDVDRAYIDYTPNKNNGGDFTLTFGILPTTGGTPMHFAQNKQRSSMFPALVFDMNTFGVIATQKFFDSFYVRAIAAKAYTLRPEFYPYQCNRENIDNANVLGLYSDLKFQFLGDSLLSFGINVLRDLKAHPYLGPDIDASYSDELGHIFTYGIGLDINNFLDTPTVIFAHTASSSPNPNGAIDDYQIDPLDPSTSGLFTEEEYATGPMINNPGYSFYVGGKYNILPTLALGAEYNYGSKYWFGATQGAEDIFNKLAIRGEAVEVYTSWNFYKNLNTKVGYLYMKENFTGSGWHFGEPETKDARQNIYYFSLEARF